MRKPLFAVAFLLLGLAPTVLACRFSVRDVGFTEIHPWTFTLRIPAEDKGLLEAARGALIDSNVEVESSAEVDAPQLVSPEGSVLELPAPVDSSAMAVFRSIVESPAREKVLEQIFSIYGAVILAEGVDSEANRRAHQAVEAAIAETVEYMKTIPKPVDLPPLKLVIPHSDRQIERVFLWALGMEPQGNRPEVAVVYGRMRKVGPTLWNEEIVADRISKSLAVIGLDCECGLDRSWMEGDRVPVVWNADREAQAVSALGFDPESPLTKMEMSQILTNGPSSPGQGNSSGADPLLGYTERALTFEAIEDFQLVDMTDRAASRVESVTRESPITARIDELVALDTIVVPTSDLPVGSSGDGSDGGESAGGGPTGGNAGSGASTVAVSSSPSSKTDAPPSGPVRSTAPFRPKTSSRAGLVLVFFAGLLVLVIGIGIFYRGRSGIV